MAHNGPYPGRLPDEPYAEPSDPWGENPIPHQQYSAYTAPPPVPSPPPATPSRPPRRGFAVGALIAVLSVLVGGGLATAVWYLLGRNDRSDSPVAADSTSGSRPRPQTSADARFANSGQCVRNEGTNTEPQLSIVACAANTYEVLKRFDGKTTGEKDAVGKCSKVPGYTKWYYYDTEYDDVDFVLCLREYQAE